MTDSSPRNRDLAASEAYEEDGESIDLPTTPAAVRDLTLRARILERENKALRAALQTARSSERQLHLLFENIVDYAIFMMDVRGIIIGWNVGAERILGYSEAEAIGAPGAMIFTEEDRARDVPAQELTGAAKKGCANDERWHRRKDGSRFWASGVMTALYNDANIHVGFAKILRDFTAQKLAEQERDRLLADYEMEHQRLSAVLRQMPAGLVISDAERVIVLSNAQADNILGVPTDATQDAPRVLTAAAGSPYAPIEPALARALAGTTVASHEVAYTKTDGREGTLVVAATPVHHQGGEVAAAVATFYDTTERQLLQAETLKASKLESIGLLAGGIAHDFNNLLTAVLGNLYLTKLSLPPDHEAQSGLAEAENACIRASGLTQQLLTFAKGGAPIKRRVSSVQLLRETTAFAARGAGVRHDVHVPDDLWPIDADEGQIAQVINNLVINAQQAMPAGGTIWLYARNKTVGPAGEGPLQPGPYIRIVLEDEGRGIAREQLSKIFDPFFTTKPKGSGLGLTTSYWIIKKHNGHIAAEPRAGKGTRFTVYLPAVPDSEYRDSGRPGDTASRSARILVMDDEAPIRSFLQRVLQHLGYEAELVDDGKQAVARYREARAEGRPFDLVMLDLSVPGGLGGKETLEQLQVIDPKVCAIVSSGYSNDPVMADFARFGFRATIGKPYRIDMLEEKLKEVLQAARRAPKNH